MCSMNIISSPHVHLKHQRQMLFVIRRANLCRCGCGGWHSFQEIFNVVSWSMRCMAGGLAPDTRHDGAAFSEALRVARFAMAPSSARV